MTIEEHRARLSEIVARQTEINDEYAGEAFPPDAKEEFERLQEEKGETERTISELETREKWLAESAEQESSREAGFNVGVKKSESDIWDLLEPRRQAATPERENELLRENAKRGLEISTLSHERASEEDKAQVERMLDTIDAEGHLARRMIATGSPVYKRAFSKALVGRELSGEERTALSTTAANGGYAVPYTLDPTIIPTSNLSVNPYRAISRVEQITTTTWQGVSSAGVTASFAAQATEASDNSPTLAQPSVTPAKAQAFIPYSIEIGQDWGALQSEMARLIQDAKDDLEADRFTFGTAATPEPEGIVKAGTAFTNTAATATFAVADVYSLEQSLPPRFRPRASFIGNRAVYNKIRQFDTAGGAQLFVQNLQMGLANQVPTPGQLGATLLGYNAGEVSAMSTATTTSSADILVIGDFNYFVIVDRIGLTVELIPHLFGSGSRYPTGQRGIYAYWRTGSVVASTNAFRKLRVL